MTSKTQFLQRQGQLEKLVKDMRLLEIYRRRSLKELRSSDIERESFETASELLSLIQSMYPPDSLEQFYNDLNELMLREQLMQACSYLSALCHRQNDISNMRQAIDEMRSVYEEDVIDEEAVHDQFHRLCDRINCLKFDEYQVSPYWRGFGIIEELNKMDHEERKQNIKMFTDIEDDLRQGGLYQFS